MEAIANAGQLIIILSSAAAGLLFIYKKVLVPLYTHFLESQERNKKIDKIYEEMTPNGGASIKDCIRRIEDGVVMNGQRWRAMVQDHDFAIFEADTLGHFTWVNRTFTRLTGRTPSELIGHGWYNTICTEERASVVQEWDSIIGEEREMCRHVNMCHQSGDKVPVCIRTYKLVNRKGKVVGYQGHINKIPEDNTNLCE